MSRQPLLRNDANAAPGAIGDFKDFGQQFLRGAIAFEGHDAAVSILDFVTAALKLHHRAANAVEQIERFKARHDQRNAELLGQRRILPVAHDAAYVAGGRNACT